MKQICHLCHRDTWMDDCRYWVSAKSAGLNVEGTVVLCYRCWDWDTHSLKHRVVEVKPTKEWEAIPTIWGKM